MPIYEYQSEHPEDRQASCYTCRSPFELRRSIARADDLRCPLCNHPIVRLVSRANIGQEEAYTTDKAKSAGFTVLNNAGDGVLEKE